MHLLAREISSYNDASVYETTQLYGEMGRFRFLQFAENAVQGAIDLKHPDRIVLEYPRAIIHLMQINRPDYANVFAIGHGIGTIAAHNPDKQFTVAEIDEKVVELSRRFFDYRMDNVIVGDGRRILEQEPAAVYDYILLDAFTHKGTPRHLTTVEFFRLTAQKLRSEGAVILNLMGKAKRDKRLSAIYATLREVFAFSQAFILPGEDEAELRNIIVTGSHRSLRCELQQMAGFIELEPEQGHLIRDGSRRTADSRDG